MATTKARAASPERGYYVTTVHNGRKTLRSSFDFGDPRMGGLVYARVDGMTGGGTAATRMLTPQGEARSERALDLEAKMHAEEEVARLKDHKKFQADRKEAYAVEAKAAEKEKADAKHAVEAAEKAKHTAEAKKEDDKPHDTHPEVKK